MEQDTYFQTATFEDVLDDLSCRFIVNIPSEELVSVPRICFQIEQAHWFYEDFIREQNPHRLPSLSLRKFSKCIFDHCPLLWKYSGSHEEEFEDFLRYKQRVPVLGGILLDEKWEKCILVKAYKGSSWSFPRGKINKDEPDVDCAIREVILLQSGVDALILPDAFIELQIKEQRVKLYIVPGVPTDTPMSPQTRKEISGIGWIKLTDLPGYSKKNKEINPGIKLYMVTPFLFGLRKWIGQNRRRKGHLIPVVVDEVGEIDKVEPEENGQTDDLVAMLRRQEPIDQSVPSDQGVDLFGMLRNGTAPTSYPEQHSQMYNEPHQLYQQNDLLALLKRPQADSQPSSYVQQEPPNSLFTASRAPSDSTVQQNGLLDILKGGQHLAAPLEPKPTTASLLDIFKSPKPTLSQTYTEIPNQRSQDVDPAKEEHRQNLLFTLKSPTLPSATLMPSKLIPNTPNRADPTALMNSPPIPLTRLPVNQHQSTLLSVLKSPKIAATEPTRVSAPQNSLLTALKSPPLPKTSSATMPSHQSSLLSALKSPTITPNEPVTVSSHQTSLLSALKSPPLSKTTPPTVSSHQSSLFSASKSPVISTAQPSQVSAHQNSLLSALTSPKLSNATPNVAPAAVVSSTHQNTLLSTLNGIVPSSAAEVAIENKTSPIHAVNSKSSQQRLGSGANRPLSIPPTPVPAHQASLLSTLKIPMAVSPTLPAVKTNTQSSLLDILKRPDVNHRSVASPPLLSKAGPNVSATIAEQDSQPEVVTAKVEAGNGYKNVHMESLLNTLTSPKTSPVVSNSLPPATKVSVPTSSDVGVSETDKVVPSSIFDPGNNAIAIGPVRGGANPPQTSDRIGSLLSTLKGSTKPVSLPPQKVPSPKQQKISGSTKSMSPRLSSSPKLQSAADGKSSTLAVKSKRAEPPVPKNALEIFPGTSQNGIGPLSPTTQTAPVPTTPTAHQQSLLSLLNPAKSPSLSPPMSPLESPQKRSPTGEQFNFSPKSQVGKRIQFREILSPTGVKDATTEPKTDQKPSSTIDLGRMTLLKKLATEETPATSELNPTRQIEDNVTNGDTRIRSPVMTTGRRKSATPTPTAQSPAIKSAPESPLGVEFPFKRRTSSRNVSVAPSPDTTSKKNTESLLALLKAPTKTPIEEEQPTASDEQLVEVKMELKPADDKFQRLLRTFRSTIHEDSSPATKTEEDEVQEDNISEPEKGVSVEEDKLGEEREKKLLAMLERALTRGVSL